MNKDGIRRLHGRLPQKLPGASQRRKTIHMDGAGGGTGIIYS